MQSTGFVDRSAVDLTSYLISGQARFEDGLCAFGALQRRRAHAASLVGHPGGEVPGRQLQGVEDYIARNSLDSADAENLRPFAANRTYNYYRYPNEIDQYRQVAHAVYHARSTCLENWDLNVTTYIVTGQRLL